MDQVDLEKKELANFVNRTAQKLADAYDSKAEWISSEAKRTFYIEQKTMNFTDSDVDNAVYFIKRHRAGKNGMKEPRIAQDAQSALAGLGKLIQRAVAFKASNKPKKLPEEKTYVAPEPEEITEEERAANLTMLKNLTEQITK